MLQNEREFRNTKIQLGRMEQALIEAQTKMAAPSDVPEVARQGHLNSISFLIDDLQAEIDKYKQLQSEEERSAIDAKCTRPKDKS